MGREQQLIAAYLGTPTTLAVAALAFVIAYELVSRGRK